jgi:4-oxalocrotonate tautomerase
VPRLIVQMIEGRTLEQKRELARRLSETVIQVLDAEPETVTVFIEEVPPENFARAGVLALDRRAAAEAAKAAKAAGE